MSSDRDETRHTLVIPERLLWLDEVTSQRRELINSIDSGAPDLPMWFRSDIPLFKDYIGSTSSETERLLLRVEGNGPFNVEALGQILVAFGTGIKRSFPRKYRSQIIISLETMGMGSVWMRVVIPVVALSVSSASLLNGLYATFAGRGAQQQALAQATSNIILDDNAAAVTFVANAGHTILRIDRSSAASYRERRMPRQYSQDERAQAPVPIPPLELPPPEQSMQSMRGSGIIRSVNGQFYIELTGVKGLLVKVFDHRQTNSPWKTDAHYGFDGQFEMEDNGFPSGYVVISAELIDRNTWRK